MNDYNIYIINFLFWCRIGLVVSMSASHTVGLVGCVLRHIDSEVI